MRLTVPAGTIGTQSDRVRITITGWRVRNDGAEEGYVGGRILLQLGQRLPVPHEDTIIDVGWVEGLPVTQYPTGRKTYTGLMAITSTTDPRRLLVWDPTAYRVRPGATVQVSFNVLIGIELLESMKNIDIVAIIERLDTVKTLGGGERRFAEAFSVAEAAPAASVPVLEGAAVANVFPF